MFNHIARRCVNTMTRLAAQLRCSGTEHALTSEASSVDSTYGSQAGLDQQEEEIIDTLLEAIMEEVRLIATRRPVGGPSALSGPIGS
jgi:hypothetical protein